MTGGCRGARTEPPPRARLLAAEAWAGRNQDPPLPGWGAAAGAQPAWSGPPVPPPPRGGRTHWPNKLPISAPAVACHAASGGGGGGRAWRGHSCLELLFWHSGQAGGTHSPGRTCGPAGGEAGCCLAPRLPQLIRSLLPGHRVVTTRLLLECHCSGVSPGWRSAGPAWPTPPRPGPRQVP